MKEILAVCPGSFDPVTIGHTDIIRRAAAMYDRLNVVVVFNSAKEPTFSPQERMEMLRKVTADLKNVTIDSYEGLLADYVRFHGAEVIVKGLRAMSDFEYEFQQALINKKLYSGAETTFLITNIENMYLSSSMVRTIAAMGGDISHFVPQEILGEIIAKFKKEGK